MGICIWYRHMEPTNDLVGLAFDSVGLQSLRLMIMAVMEERGERGEDIISHANFR